MNLALTRRLVPAGTLAILLGAAGCALHATASHRLVAAWLACTECDAGQFDSVVALGHTHAGHLAVVAELRSAALATADSARIRAELSGSYDSARSYALRTFAALPAGWPGRSDWVGQHLGIRIAVVQARALRALSAVDSGGGALRAALDTLASRPLRPDIRSMVDSLRALNP